MKINVCWGKTILKVLSCNISKFTNYNYGYVYTECGWHITNIQYITDMITHLFA